MPMDLTRQSMVLVFCQRLHCCMPIYSLNSQSRFPIHFAESTRGLHRLNGTLSRASSTLTPWIDCPGIIKPSTSRIRNPNPSIEPSTQWNFSDLISINLSDIQMWNVKRLTTSWKPQSSAASYDVVPFFSCKKEQM